MLERIAKILRDYKEDETLVITEETTFEELGLDSLDIVDLVVNVEDEFSITIEMDGGINSVGKLMGKIKDAQKTEE